VIRRGIAGEPTDQQVPQPILAGAPPAIMMDSLRHGVRLQPPEECRKAQPGVNCALLCNHPPMASEFPIDRAQINCPDSLSTGSERSRRMCKTWLGASLRRSTRQRQSRICAFRLVTDSRNCRGIGKGSGASRINDQPMACMFSLGKRRRA